MFMWNECLIVRTSMVMALSDPYQPLCWIEGYSTFKRVDLPTNGNNVIYELRRF